MLSHRPTIDEDLAAICGFAQTPQELYFFFPKADYPLTTKQLIQVLKERTYATTIEHNEIIAGFANFYYWQENGVCKIGNVAVNPTLRKKGIAQYLMQIMQEKAKQYYNATEIQVSCFNHNTAGLLLYKKLGFKAFDIEQRLDKQQNQIALIHLRKQC